MKRKLKSILILMFAFVFMSLSFSNAKIVKAASVDDAVIGTKNLNNTPENSAKIREQLLEPEKGWKRYDSANVKLEYEPSKWKTINDKNSHGNSYMRPILQKGETATIKFGFLGDKIRIIGNQSGLTSASAILVKIDGEIMGQAHFNGTSDKFMKYKFLAGEYYNLDNKFHTVELTSEYYSENLFCFDAIDIPVDGKLVSYDFDPSSENPVPTNITLDKTSINLPEGSSEKLTATVLPENATNKKVIWSSSDESIAKVDENGNITAKKEGKAIITAKVENTDLTATCEVNVSKLVEENKNNAILSISLVNGATKEYDVSMEEVNKFINWFEERANGKGSELYSFDKKINPYKSVKEYIAHDKIASFEVREYEISK